MWQNIYKLYAEYKQAMHVQKSRIECVKDTVYIGCKTEM